MSWLTFLTYLAQIVIAVVVLAAGLFFGSAFVAALLEAGRDAGERARGDEPDESDPIEVVASAVVANLVEAEIGELWELYPEIGEHDWLAVQERATARAKEIHPGSAPFLAAYAQLEGRAETETA